MMINKYFCKVKKSSQQFWLGLRHFLICRRQEVSKIFQNLRNLDFKMKNLISNNLNLGIYHLKRHHYNDAIFRFKLIDKFLDPGNMLANYWLGWVYFIQKKYPKSVESLQNTSLKEAKKLVNFINSLDSINYVTEDIYMIYRDIMAEQILEPYLHSEVNIAVELVSYFNFYASDLPRDYQIAELGANIGILGNEIRGRMQDHYQVTAVESSERMLELSNIYFPETRLYDQIIIESVERFITTTQQKFDVIYSLNSLNYQLDLLPSFTHIADLLNIDGYFAFAIEQADRTHFDRRTMQFVYEQQYIIENLEKTGLKIMHQQEISLVMKNKYSIFICVKSP